MFNFNFGKRKLDIKQYAIIGIVLSSVIATLSQCTGVSQNGLWRLFDEIQRRYIPSHLINPFILQNPPKLKKRIEDDVTQAIDKVTPEYDRIIEKANQKYKPKYIEEKNDESVCYTDECKALAPPMRICASWIENCN